MCGRLKKSPCLPFLEQLSFGKCTQTWMTQPATGAPNGYCATTCGRCSCPKPSPPPPPPACTCDDIQPGGGYTCAQQQSFGKCTQTWITQPGTGAPNGYCATTCGRCSCAPKSSPPPPPPPPPRPSPPPPACTCDDVQPGGGYTCAQQKSFGKCTQSWMTQPGAGAPNGYCATTCGRCSCPSG